MIARQRGTSVAKTEATKERTWTDWFLGILLGDFYQGELSESQIIVRSALTSIPGIDQVADIQDALTALYDLAWEGKWDDEETKSKKNIKVF